MGRRAVALALVVALGLHSRTRPIGVPLYDASLGDALYAAAVYLVLGLLRPRWPPLTLAGVAFAACLAIELFQLTGIPARHASLSLVRWLLGTHFAWADLLCYGVGVLAMLGLESGARARKRG
jgi:hypothetical protein